MACFSIISPSLLFFFIFTSSLSSASNITAIFTFGDSIFDAGNNRFNPNCSIQANFPPYGQTFFHHPTGRFTNGRTVADFVSKFLGIPLQKPYLELELLIANGTLHKYPDNGINFASAGSGIMSDTNAFFGVTSIATQLRQLEAMVKQNKINKNIIQRAFFFFESGSNDIFQYYFLNSQSTNLTGNGLVQAMVQGVENWVRRVYELGARRISLFGLGPVGCVPATMLLANVTTNGCHKEMNQLIQKFNLGLETIAREMPKKFPGAHVVYGATFDIVMEFRALPKRYGFNNTTAACCGEGTLGGMGQCGVGEFTVCNNPGKFLFWDFFHPTEHAYELLSKAFWGGKWKRIRPINLKTLANMAILPPS